MVLAKGYVFVQSKTGKEKELLEELLKLPEILEAHLIPGRYDILAVAEVEASPVEPQAKVMDLVVDKLTKIRNVADTNTVIPSMSESKSVYLEHPERSARAFVFIRTKAGKEQDVMKELLRVDEVEVTHLVLGRSDVLAVVRVEMGVAPPLPERIARIVTEKIAKLSDVLDTETYAPTLSRYKP